MSAEEHELRQRRGQYGADGAKTALQPKSAPEQTATPSPLATGRALILLQLMSRLLTFVMNQRLVRLAPPAVLGTAAIQFDLVAATIMFLSREGTRNALLRSRDGDEERKGKKSNGILSAADTALAAWPLRLGLVVTFLTVSLYLYTSPISTTSQRHFHLALGLYVVGAILELAIEPLYIRATRSGALRVRVQAEGGQAAARAAASFLILEGLRLAGDDGSLALLGLAAGYAAGSVWLAGRYLLAFRGAQALTDLIAPSAKAGDSKTRSLAIANTRQSVIKHVLTEADRIAVGKISPLGDQGGYAVAINYGSLVARIIFQPVEETLLLHWSRTLDSPSSISILQVALRLSLHLLVLLPVFLLPLLPAVLPLLLPRRYTAETSAAQTLQTYLVCYIPLLSLNGILESFHTASATPAQVSLQARVMAASSVAFAGSLYLLATAAVPKGNMTTEQALIYASCAAMLVRIGYAYVHARRFAQTAGQGSKLAFSEVVPRAPVLGVVGLLGAGVWALENCIASNQQPGLRGALVLIGAGGAAGVAVLLTVYTMESKSVRALRT